MYNTRAYLSPNERLHDVHVTNLTLGTRPRERQRYLHRHENSNQHTRHNQTKKRNHGSADWPYRRSSHKKTHPRRKRPQKTRTTYMLCKANVDLTGIRRIRIHTRGSGTTSMLNKFAGPLVQRRVGYQYVKALPFLACAAGARLVPRTARA